MTTLAPKRPSEVRRYVLDYARELGEDAIASFDLSVSSGAVLVQSSEQMGPHCISTLLSSGTDGQTSKLELQITTECGQVLFRDLSILTANASNATGALPSSTTKGQVVNMAFGEAGMPGYEFDATATEQADALTRLDSLMAIMASPGENLDLGYNFPAAVGGSAMTDISGIPDLALDYVIGRLALSIAPGIGKTLGVEARRRMAESLRAVRATFARIPEMRPARSTPRGAGGKPWSTWQPFVGAIGPLGSPTASQPQTASALGTENGWAIQTENGETIGV